MRQFRFDQNIPTNPLNLDQLHMEDIRERTDQYWPQYHRTWVTMRNECHNCVIQGIPFTKNGHLHDNTPYIQ